MLLGRPSIGLGFSLTPVASVVAAAVAGEDHGADRAADGGAGDATCSRATTAPPSLLGVRRTRFDAAIERALREWEAVEELGAR